VQHRATGDLVLSRGLRLVALRGEGQPKGIPQGVADGSVLAVIPVATLLQSLPESERMTFYLVTGGAGFVGSHLVEDLVDSGHRVRVLDDLSTGLRGYLSPAVELIEGDVTHVETVRRAFEGVDGCFHLAATASVERCHHEWLRSHRVNLSGTINIFDQARRASAEHATPVVYASSAAVYGDCGVAGIGEDYPFAPLSSYGADKAACEFQARVAGSVHGVPTAGLRFFNLYGPRQDVRSPYSGVISIFADRVLRGRPIQIFGDGEQVRDFTFVGDAVAALRRAMEVASTAAPVVNVCTGTGTSVRQLAETIADLCDTQPVIHHAAARSGDIRSSIGDPSRAADYLGFRARTPLPHGLAITLQSIDYESDACVAA
jgi:UDP-glucose 4-epimerase